MEKEKWNEYMRKYRKEHPEVNKNACDKWRKAHSLQVSDYAHEYYMKRKGKKENGDVQQLGYGSRLGIQN